MQELRFKCLKHFTQGVKAVSEGKVMGFDLPLGKFVQFVKT